MRTTGLTGGFGINAWLFSATLACFAAPAYAQDLCKDILQFGVHDVVYRDHEIHATSFVARNSCTQSGKKVTASAKLLIKNVPVGGNYSESEHSKACERVQRRSSLDKTDIEYLRTASEIIVAAWESCMSDRDGARFGLKQDIVDDRKIHGIVKFRNPMIGNNLPLKVVLNVPKELDVGSCACATGACVVNRFKKQILIELEHNEETSFSCRRALADEFTLQADYPSSVHANGKFPVLGSPATIGAIDPVRLAGGPVMQPPYCEVAKVRKRPRPTITLAVLDAGPRFDVNLKTVSPNAPAGASFVQAINLFEKCDGNICIWQTESAIDLRGHRKHGSEIVNGLWLYPTKAGSQPVQLISQLWKRLDNCPNDFGSRFDGLTLKVIKD